jgi:hypothetical protein
MVKPQCSPELGIIVSSQAVSAMHISSTSIGLSVSYLHPLGSFMAATATKSVHWDFWNSSFD